MRAEPGRARRRRMPTIVLRSSISPHTAIPCSSTGSQLQNADGH
jgi:hypothetical protein